jgi:hypothetical protein
MGSSIIDRAKLGFDEDLTKLFLGTHVMINNDNFCMSSSMDAKQT